MSSPVLILPLASGLYEARTEYGLSARGDSPEQALANLREVMEREYVRRRAAVTVSVPTVYHDWSTWTGSLDLDDPVVKEWVEAVQEYRRSVDDDPKGL